MIDKSYIQEWRKNANWSRNIQVEQDLILSRALVELYQQPEIARRVALRGGTALHKLFFLPAGRYSEDIDLVQRDAEPIGQLINAMRDTLDPWLGQPQWEAKQRGFNLYYKCESTTKPITKIKLKVEINTREHGSVFGLIKKNFEVKNPWFSGKADIATYQLSELLGTKLRALYQRRQGRDLFDLWLGLQYGDFSVENLLESFGRYMEFSGTRITRAEFEANMSNKVQDNFFLSDLGQLLPSSHRFDFHDAWQAVHEQIVSRLPGNPWNGINRGGLDTSVLGR